MESNITKLLLSLTPVVFHQNALLSFTLVHRALSLLSLLSLFVAIGGNPHVRELPRAA